MSFITAGIRHTVCRDKDRWRADMQIKKGSSQVCTRMWHLNIHPLRCCWAIQMLNLNVLAKKPSQAPFVLLLPGPGLWRLRCSGPPTHWTPIILAASPLLATLFRRTQITACSFQLSILLLWLERNAYRCLRRGELQASGRPRQGRAGASFSLCFLGAVRYSWNLRRQGEGVQEDHIHLSCCASQVQQSLLTL